MPTFADVQGKYNASDLRLLELTPDQLAQLRRAVAARQLMAARAVSSSADDSEDGCDPGSAALEP